MSAFPNLSYRYNAVPINIPARYCFNINKPILIFVWEDRKPKIPTWSLSVGSEYYFSSKEYLLLREKMYELDTNKTRQTPLQARTSRLTLVVISHFDTKYPRDKELGMTLFLNCVLPPDI
jgi:hypothetical protein